MIDTKQAAIASMKSYFAAHPRSPSALWRPLLFRDGNVWTASLVPNLRGGVAGVGTTVEAALSDFDAQYLRVLRSPEVSSKSQRVQRNEAIIVPMNSPACSCHAITLPAASTDFSVMHVYEVRPRKDKRGVDLICDVLPFGRLWFDTPDHAIGYAMHRSRSHDAVIRVYVRSAKRVRRPHHRSHPRRDSITLRRAP